MKKVRSLILACILTSTILGCSSERATLSSERDPTSLIWDKDDFKKTDRQLEKHTTVKINMQGLGLKTVYRAKKKIPKYAVYTYYNKRSTSFVDLAWDFGEFWTIFFYRDEDKLTIAEGARTFDKSGRLVAEARLVGFLDKELDPQRFEIEEAHYGPEGDLIFTCKSRFDDLGVKIVQAEEQGKKRQEYYFIWAVGF